MSPTTKAILGSWSLDPLLALGLLVIAAVYVRGWRVLHRVLPARFSGWRLGAFLSGLFALWFAIASPLDAFGGLLLSAHMVQHLLLMSVAPPLLLLGAPALPLLRGLPRGWARDGLGPFIAWPPLRRVGRWLVDPRVGWLALTANLVVWHVPTLFQLALGSPAWHRWEHASFLVGALLFWWPVIGPFPSQSPWPQWAMALYLLAADIINSVLCAILTFSDRVLYPVYNGVPRIGGITALSDQVAAGVIMWVPGSIVFLVPAVGLMIRWLSPRETLIRPTRIKGETLAVRIRAPTPGKTLPVSRNFDLLTVPLIGQGLRASWGRRCAQAISLAIAVAVMIDGWFGSPVASDNLAGIVPWIDWRALTVLALLVVGNVFCFACPFMLPRELGRRLRWNSHAWPRPLRSKWLAVVLLIAFAGAYEAWGLWDRPSATAWLVLAYFAGAVLVDGWFKGASFCKYVCPIGQFQFVASLVSPLEVRVRQPDACTRCTTHDCLRGNEHRRGCELDLYLPRKSGSLDCTFCLDCVHACPHDNIGVLTVAPGAPVLSDVYRAGLGRLSQRIDVAALALVVVLIAFANAAAMTTPVAAAWQRLAEPWGKAALGQWATFGLVAAMVVIPGICVGAAIQIGRVASGLAPSWRELFCRFAFTLVPVGVAMWCAHGLFHLMSGPSVLGPWLHQQAVRIRFPFTDAGPWEFRWMGFSSETVLCLQAALLGAGFLLTLYLGWRLIQQYASSTRGAWGFLGCWAPIAVALYAVGIWICVQPMAMRGIGNQ